MVKSYISAIKAVLFNIGVELKCDQVLLGALTKACRLVNDQIKTRLPIHKDMLEVLLKCTKIHFLSKNQPYLSMLYRALFSTAYFGLFRIGELTSGEHPVLVKDVQIGLNKRKLLFVLWTSETHWKNVRPQMVKISSVKATTSVVAKMAKRKNIESFKSKLKPQKSCP